MLRIPAQRRPHYPPIERLAILELRAARGWSMSQTARHLLVTPVTVASWMGRLDEEGPRAIVQIREPVNKFPNFVRYIVQRLKVPCPTMGKVKIAHRCCRQVRQHRRDRAIDPDGQERRLIRTVKNECTRRLLIPYRRDSFRRELALFATWYNGNRPSKALAGKSPDEVYHDLAPACLAPRFEPRRKWPRDSPCAAPRAIVRGRRGVRLEMNVSYLARLWCCVLRVDLTRSRLDSRLLRPRVMRSTHSVRVNAARARGVDFRWTTTPYGLFSKRSGCSMWKAQV